MHLRWLCHCGEDSQSILSPLFYSGTVFVWICRIGLEGKKMKIQRGRSDKVRVSGLNSCQNMDQAYFFQVEHLWVVIAADWNECPHTPNSHLVRSSRGYFSEKIIDNAEFIWYWRSASCYKEWLWHLQEKIRNH